MQSRPVSFRQALFAGALAALVLGAAAPAAAIEMRPPAQNAQAQPAQADAAAPAAAVDEARLRAGLQIWKDGGCRGCHGWAATGEREGPNPVGPSLRTTTLDEAGIHLAVACGRPGTEMPYFWREAYRRTSTECYGVTGADLGDAKPLRGAKRFNEADIADVAYYIANFLKGRGEITAEECEFYWGEGNARCEAYK